MGKTTAADTVPWIPENMCVYLTNVISLEILYEIPDYSFPFIWKCHLQFHFKDTNKWEECILTFHMELHTTGPQRINMTAWNL